MSKKMTRWNWLKLFSLIYIVGSITLPSISEEGMEIMIITPFLHLMITLILEAIHTHSSPTKDVLKKKDNYIYENYPDIWKKLHPWGKGSFNSFGTIYFMRLETNDSKLIEIQNDLKDDAKWHICTFILAPIIWALSVGTFVLFGPSS